MPVGDERSLRQSADHALDVFKASERAMRSVQVAVDALTSTGTASTELKQ